MDYDQYRLGHVDDEGTRICHPTLLSANLPIGAKAQIGSFQDAGSSLSITLSQCLTSFFLALSLVV